MTKLWKMTPHAALPTALESAIAQSDYFILLASPETAVTVGMPSDMAVRISWKSSGWLRASTS